VGREDACRRLRLGRDPTHGGLEGLAAEGLGAS
jgi:hypothetical protein